MIDRDHGLGAARQAKALGIAVRTARTRARVTDLAARLRA